MTRREFSPKVRLAAYQRADGHCEDCRAPLAVGRFAYDHTIPDGLGGEPTLDNCMVLCRACHGAKTATADVPKIAKAKRVKRKSAGISTRKAVIPGSRASRFKRRLDGTVEKRW